MTFDSNAWIGIIVIAVLVVAAIAVWKGRGFSAKLPGFKFGTQEEQPRKIKVANKLKGVDFEAGKIVGTSLDDSESEIEVANQARFKRAKIKDIIGVESQSQAASPHKPAETDRP